MTNEQIQDKLAKLRVEWRNNPNMRKIIETRARLLKLALGDEQYEYAKNLFEVEGN